MYVTYIDFIYLFIYIDIFIWIYAYIIYIFIYSMYMSNPIFRFILLAASSPVTISLFSTSVTFCFVNKFICLVQFSHSVMSDSLWPHGLQHARSSCPSPTPRACSNSYPLNRWCHPTISSSVVPFSSCLGSFPASGSFWMSLLFASGDRSIGVSVSASVLPVNIQDWFRLG